MAAGTRVCFGIISMTKVQKYSTAAFEAPDDDHIGSKHAVH
jgi:hypothetical protein